MSERLSAAPRNGGGGHHGRVLVAGAGGFLGKEIVRVFASHGWQARGLIRNAVHRDGVKVAGGEPVLGDVLDVGILTKHAKGCDVVVHVASTRGDGSDQLDRLREVRVQGVRNLVEAAHSCRVRRLVVGSGYWVYASQKGTLTEDSPVNPRGESLINYETERVGLAANSPSKMDVLVVRPGMVYGDGAWFRPVVEEIQNGTYRVIEGGSNFWSFVSLQDTASGFLAVAEEGRAGEIYNIVDGHPAHWVDFASFVAERLGQPAPPSQSMESAVEAYGRTIADHLCANRAASSTKLAELGWKPKYPRFRDGVGPLLREMRRRRSP